MASERRRRRISMAEVLSGCSGRGGARLPRRRFARRLLLTAITSLTAVILSFLWLPAPGRPLEWGRCAGCQLPRDRRSCGLGRQVRLGWRRRRAHCAGESRLGDRSGNLDRQDPTLPACAHPRLWRLDECHRVPIPRDARQDHRSRGRLSNLALTAATRLGSLSARWYWNRRARFSRIARSGAQRALAPASARDIPTVALR
jgi:hypothetical protein